VVDTATGRGAVPPDLLDLSRSLKASRLQEFKTSLCTSPGESTVPWPGMGDAELRVERGGGQ